MRSAPWLLPGLGRLAGPRLLPVLRLLPVPRLLPVLRLLTGLLLPAVVNVAAEAQGRRAGVWDMVCPAGPHSCLLRHRAAYLHSGGLSVALEIQGRAGALVPVVVAEGLSAQAALTTSLAGHLSVGLRFDHGRWIEMSCETMAFCAPDAADVQSVAAALPLAHAMTLRIDLVLPGVSTLPRPERTFDLSGTAAALDALRRSGPQQEAMPAEPGLDLPGLMNKLMGGGSKPAMP